MGEESIFDCAADGIKDAALAVEFDFGFGWGDVDVDLGGVEVEEKGGNGVAAVGGERTDGLVESGGEGF